MVATTTATTPSSAPQGNRDGQAATTAAANAGDTVHNVVTNVASTVGTTASNVGSGISGFFDRFSKTTKEHGIGQAISDAFSEMGTGGFIGAILGGIGAMFIGSVFGGGLIGMIAGILMVPLGIMLGSQQGRGPIEHGVSSILGATPRTTTGATNTTGTPQMDPALAAAYQQAIARDAANGGSVPVAPPQTTFSPAPEYQHQSYSPGYSPRYSSRYASPPPDYYNANADYIPPYYGGYRPIGYGYNGNANWGVNLRINTGRN